MNGDDAALRLAKNENQEDSGSVPKAGSVPKKNQEKSDPSRPRQAGVALEKVSLQLG